MRALIDMRVLELLTARLCHELIGPVTAVNNGAELLREDDRGFGRDALDLVEDSARRAAARLGYYRFAYASSGDSDMAGPAPGELAAGFFAMTGIVCDYPAALRQMPMPWQKLACNLLLVGADALPRGGRLALSIPSTTTTPAALEMAAAGPRATLSDEALAALSLATATETLTSRTVQPYFSGLLARTMGYRLHAETQAPDRVRLIASAP
jgi:histidine phosphotransferase ChpT